MVVVVVAGDTSATVPVFVHTSEILTATADTAFVIAAAFQTEPTLTSDPAVNLDGCLWARPAGLVQDLCNPKPWRRS